MKFAVLLAAAVPAAIASLPTAAAAETLWNMPGTGCEVTLGKDDVARTAGAVTFQPDRTGLIRLSCPITDIRGVEDRTKIPGTLGMTYRDGDGSADGASITMILKMTRFDNGITFELGRLSSNVQPAASIGFHSARYATTLPASARRFDFEAGYYNVEVILKRSNTNQQVVFAGAAIMTAP